MLIIILALFSSTPTFAGNCEDLQAYRRQAMEKFKSQSPSQPMQQCLDQAVNGVQRQQESDLWEIKKTLKQIKKETGQKLPASIEDIQKFFHKDSALSRAVGKMQAEQKQAFTDQKTHNMQKWLLRGPIENFATAVGGFDFSKNDPGESQDLMGPALKELKAGVEKGRLKNKKYTIQDHLIKVASRPSAEKSYDDDRTRLTPFIAKMILFESIRQNDETAEKRHLRELVGNLELKAIHNQYYKAKDIPPEDLDYVTIHNGYILGASERWLKNLKNRNPVSKGIDCATLVQNCLEETSGKPWPTADHKEDGGVYKVRLNTAYLNNLVTGDADKVPAEPAAFYRSNFRFKSLTDERQLAPGDVIFFKGHMVVFAGYERNKTTGEIEPITYEADGGEMREAGRFRRQFYSDKKDCTKLSLNPANSPLYILDFAPAGSFREGFQPLGTAKGTK